MQGASSGAPSSSGNNNNGSNNDDENSQAESNNFEPAPMAPQQQPPTENPVVNHYENVDAAAAVVPLGVPALPNEPNVAQIVNLQHNRAVPPQSQYIPHHRNDVYDVPRNARNVNINNNSNNFYVNGNQRRSNLHLDFNRPRCPVGVTHQKHQRSFDDTESCYGYNYNNNGSMYERIGNQREEPLYQNAGLAVIGHGIGRIERHLSSSCGNIDHYNVGGHYAAVLSHTHGPHHYSNVPVNSVQNPRDGVKSFFSCLGGESSQSLSHINGVDESGQPTTANPRPTGAIPKTKSKQSNKVSPKPATPPIPPPKSSLQYLLLNKWLPLGPDYKIIDFNFMFSGRNCSTAGLYDAREGVVQFNGQAEMVEPGVYQPQREYPTMNPTNYPRVIRNTPQLSRLRESDAEDVVHRGVNAFRARSESPIVRHRNPQEDPFRNWSFNFENNSFRPAGVIVQRDVRRITDGTLAQKDFQEQNPRKELPAIVVDQQEAASSSLSLSAAQEPQPSTSKSTSPSEHSNASTSSSSVSMKTSEMKKSENYENLASLQRDAPGPSGSRNQRKKKSTESQSSDSVTLAEEDEEDAEDAFEELESDID